MNSLRVFAVVLAASICDAAPAPWVQRSNENARLLLDVMAKFSPEGAGRTGIEGLDEQISDFTAGSNERSRAATREAGVKLRALLRNEKDPLVRQDLEILIDATEKSVRASEINEKLLLPYINVTQVVFGGLRSLLDDQIAAGRRPAALVRLRKYAGMTPGFEPVAKLAEQRTRERLKQPGLLEPVKSRVEQDLANGPLFLSGIGQLFQKYKIEGYEEPLAKLKEQIAAYDTFVKAEVLPRARTDFRLPPELYTLALENYGVDIPAAELVKKAHAAFDEIQKEMQSIAPKVAKERGWTLTDYRDVIRELKKEQLTGDAILAHYKARLEQIEAIVRRENLVTLPDRVARIRIATPAESAASPAPNMRPPRLIGNTGESGEFVLPLNIPDASGKMQGYDDFTFAAASWTLAVHELRPGHEMQFASLVENGVSTARAVFAFNSANVEGWGLYSEAVVKPFMPLEGQLISLQHRLLRAARAYLDPELQMGKVTPEEATRVLTGEVMLSPAMARQEVERYTFRSPGQATSYFYGFIRLMEIRAGIEKKLGRKFEPKRFHDFLLAQGLLPPNLLRAAVDKEFAR